MLVLLHSREFGEFLFRIQGIEFCLNNADFVGCEVVGNCEFIKLFDLNPADDSRNQNQQSYNWPFRKYFVVRDSC